MPYIAAAHRVFMIIRIGSEPCRIIAYPPTNISETLASDTASPGVRVDVAYARDLCHLILSAIAGLDSNQQVTDGGSPRNCKNELMIRQKLVLAKEAILRMILGPLVVLRHPCITITHTNANEMLHSFHRRVRRGRSEFCFRLKLL